MHESEVGIPMFMVNVQGLGGCPSRSRGYTSEVEGERGRLVTASVALPGSRIGIIRSSILGITSTCCKHIYYTVIVLH